MEGDKNIGGNGKRILIIEHERETPGGLIEQWFIEHGINPEHLRIDIENRIPDPKNYDLIVSLGSEYAAYDDSIPFVPREMELFKKSLAIETPILGICFGAHLLARVLGADVFKSSRAEVGWFPVRSHNLEIVPSGPWFQWHFDTFRLPQGAILLADSEVGPQVFSVSGGVGIQFHPEVTPEIMDDWVKTYPHELEQVGIEPQHLLEETKIFSKSNSKNANRLIKRCVTRLVGMI